LTQDFSAGGSSSNVFGPNPVARNRDDVRAIHGARWGDRGLWSQVELTTPLDHQAPTAGAFGA
jgi:hypothetical protein